MRLDLECALAGQRVIETAKAAKVKKAEAVKLCTNGGAILASHGLYAYFLFLTEKKPLRADLCKGTYDLLAKVFPMDRATDARRMLQGVQKLCGDLDHLLLAKQLATETLTYTKEFARSLQDEKRPK